MFWPGCGMNGGRPGIVGIGGIVGMNGGCGVDVDGGVSAVGGGASAVGGGVSDVGGGASLVAGGGGACCVTVTGACGRTVTVRVDAG
jgi:hypothetical protein